MTGPDPASLPQQTGTMAAANRAARLLKQAMASRDAALLDQAITDLRAVLASTAATDPDLAGRLSNLGTALQLRLPRSRSQADLTAAVTAARAAVAATRPGDPDAFMYLANLFFLLTVVMGGVPAAGLDEIIAAGRAAWAQAPPGYPHLAEVLSRLATALHARYGRSGRLTDLDSVIDIRRIEQAGLPAGRDQALGAMRLSRVLRLRAERTGRLADAAAAVSAAELALAGIGAGDQERPLCVAVLAAALRQRASLGRAQPGRAQPGRAQPDQPGRAQPDRGQPGGAQPDRAQPDLDEAVRLLADAAAATGPGPVGTHLRSELCLTLLERYRLVRDPADLDQAVSAGEAAVAAATTDGDRAIALGNLGGARHARARHHGDPADLDAAIEAERAALTACAAVPGDYADHLSGLSNKLRVRFWWSGRLADADEAADAARQALAIVSPGDARWAGCLPPQFAGHVLAASQDVSRRARYLTSLGGAQHAQAWATGDQTDLTEAVGILRVALRDTPPGVTDYPRRQGDLGVVLQLRAQRTGSLADLDEAITVLRDAAGGLPAADPGRARYLAQLGAGWLARYQQADQPADLDQAIGVLTQAVLATSAGDPDRCVRQINLSGAQQLRYDRTRQPAHLREAIETARDALTAAPEDHPSRATLGSNLAARLLARFEQDGHQADLDEAVSVARQAVASCRPGQPQLAGCLAALADALAASPGAAQWDEAFGCWRRAVDEAAAPASSRILAAWSWGTAAAARHRFALAEDGFSAAVGLLPLLAWRGLDRGSQELQLARLPGLASDAAACAIAAGHPERAVELLEHGRGVLWSQLLQLRGELDELRRSAPDLARQLDLARALLDQPGQAGDLSSADGPGTGLPGPAAAPLPDLGDARMQHATAWDALVRQVRTRPGFEHFLDIPPFADLARASAGGTVVIVNVSDHGCHALALTAAGLTVIPLPKLTRKAARDQANAFLAAVRQAGSGPQAVGQAGSGPQAGAQAGAEPSVVVDGVLGWLAEAVTTPVLAAVRDPGHAGAELPRIWWCPTGPLAVLPLHAAGPPDGDRVLDQVISSYTPTLRALHDARTRPAHTAAGPARMLLITMPVTGYLAGGAPLPGTGDEAEIVARRFLTRMKHLTGPTATREHVLGALDGASFAHFACHGGIQPADPSAGGLYLADGPLTIAELSGHELAAAELAFLSACESAAGSVRHLDESITMAAAVQVAGFRHVIATLWYAADSIAPQLARAVYDALAETDTAPGPPPGAGSARALHAAVRGLRAAGHPPLLWAPYLHVGP